MKMQKNGWADSIMAVECKYKEMDRGLKEWFINGLNGDGLVVGNCM